MISRPLPAWLGYHILAHLDLGPDAANLFDARLPRPPWLPALLTERPPLSAQFAPLFSFDLDELYTRLPPSWAPALAAEAPRVAAALAADEPGPRHQRFLTEVLPDLERARAALWGRPPPLRLLDVPALGRHARAAALPDGTRLVATSLDQSTEHLFCQVLHEEVHPHSDPIVLRALEGVLSDRDTQLGSAGWALHQALEVAAVEGGRQIVEGVLPHRAADYARWCRRQTTQSSSPKKTPGPGL